MNLHPATDTANPGSRQSAALAALVLWALVLLALGALVYGLDRPAGSAWALPSGWQLGSGAAWFGAVGGWLPSFVHAFGFSVLTAWVLTDRELPPSRWGVWVACGGWALVETLFELGQHRALSPWLAGTLGQAFDHSAWAQQLGRYFTRGVFDPADLVAAWTGCALAAMALLWARAAAPTAAPTAERIAAPGAGPGRPNP